MINVRAIYLGNEAEAYILDDFIDGGVRTVTWTAAYAASPNRLLRLSIVS